MIVDNQAGGGGASFPSQGGNAGKVLGTNGTTVSWVTTSGGGNALTSQPLSQFAGTTSAQLRGVITDETGGGVAVFADTPTLTTPILISPNLGTPTALALPFATGLSLVGGVTGVLPVPNGGTNLATLTANNVILGNGTSSPLFVAPGTNGNVLTSNGTTWTSAASAGGTTPTGIATFSGNNPFYGINSFSGAVYSIFTPMGGLVVDVTKAGNSYSAAGDASLSYSNPTPSLGTSTMLRIATDATACTITIPSTYSLARSANITSLFVPVSGTLQTKLQYLSNRWEIINDPLPSLGSGSFVLNSGTTLVSPNLGEPVFLSLKNATGLSLVNGATGVLSVANGGLATNQLGTGLLIGSGLSSVVTLVPGTSGNVLQSDGNRWYSAPLSISGSGGGTVTSIPDGSTNGVAWTVANRTTTPTFTYTLGAITPTTVNKVTITAPASAATLTLVDGTTVTGPATTDTLVGRATTDTLTNKTINGASNTLTVRLANDVSGTLPVVNGGTNQTTYTDGQLLIGNTTGNTLAKATLTGTTSQIVVTNGGGSITLSTPQDIATTSKPVFANIGLTISALTYSSNVAVDFAGDAFKTLSLTGDWTPGASSNLPSAGTSKSVTIFITCDATPRNFDFSTVGWIFVGPDGAPTSIAPSKKAVLTLTTTSTTDASVFAAYAVQA